MKYSEVDLIGEKDYLRSGEASWKYKLFFKWFASKEVVLTLELPETDLDRAWLLCEDIERLTEEEIEPVMILEVLVESFLKELSRKGSLAAFDYLVERSSKTVQVNHYQVSTSDEVQQLDKPKDPLSTYKVEIDRKAVYRLEVFLMELDQLTEHHLTVEKVLETLFCYVIDLVRKDGGKTFIKKLIKYIHDADN